MSSSVASASHGRRGRVAAQFQSAARGGGNYHSRATGARRRRARILVTAEFVRLLELASLREGRMRACAVAGREILVCRTSTGVFAVDNVCTHACARMSEGSLRGTRVTCPLHGASFDVRDGRVLGGPAIQPLAAYATRVVEGNVEVAVHGTMPDSPAGE